MNEYQKSRRATFAAMAMQGFLSDSSMVVAIRETSLEEGLTFEAGLAKGSVQAADALIAELDATHPQESK